GSFGLSIATIGFGFTSNLWSILFTRALGTPLLPPLTMASKLNQYAISGPIFRKCRCASLNTWGTHRHHQSAYSFPYLRALLASREHSRVSNLFCADLVQLSTVVHDDQPDNRRFFG